MGYVSNKIIAHVIDLFRKEPKYRDDRQGTVLRIIKDFYSPVWGHNMKNDCKLVYDVDRAFRFVQQHVPQLRGAKWHWRQYMSGEISRKEYELSMKNINSLKNLCVQQELKFE